MAPKTQDSISKSTDRLTAAQIRLAELQSHLKESSLQSIHANVEEIAVSSLGPANQIAALRSRNSWRTQTAEITPQASCESSPSPQSISNRRQSNREHPSSPEEIEIVLNMVRSRIRRFSREVQQPDKNPHEGGTKSYENAAATTTPGPQSHEHRPLGWHGWPDYTNGESSQKIAGQWRPKTRKPSPWKAGAWKSGPWEPSARDEDAASPMRKLIIELPSTGQNAETQNYPTRSRDSNTKFASGGVMKRTIPNNPPSELFDWDGSWAPPPVDWENRPQADNQEDDLQKSVMMWVCDISDDRHALDGVTCEKFLHHPGDFCPRGWIITHVESIKLSDWWTQHMRDPQTSWEVSDPDPFWQCFIGDRSPLMQPMHVPNLVCDPEDELYDSAKLQGTSEMSVRQYRISKSKKKASARDKRFSRQKSVEKIEDRVRPDNLHAPSVQMYLRPFQAHDAPQIASIWSHYVTKTVYSAGKNPQLKLPEDVCKYLTELDAKKMPVLVAILGAPISATSRFGNRRSSKQVEKLLGFGFADDKDGQQGMFRYTAEVEIFVRSEECRRGVGRTIFDKMMSILDSAYAGREGAYDFAVNTPGQSCHFTPGGRRQIDQIQVKVLWASDDEERIEWITRWLAQWRLEKFGEFPRIGDKLDKKVTQSVFMKKTGVDPDMRF